MNASAEVLRKLPEEICGCGTEKVLLPVVFGKAAEKALQYDADYCFLLGEAGGRPEVTPEIRAVNFRNARIPDNEGKQPQEEMILTDGPAEYHTTVPVREIVDRMRKEGYAIAVSENAGSYVCNETFYLAGMQCKAPVVFIHVPAKAEEADPYADTVSRFIDYAVLFCRV